VTSVSGEHRLPACSRRQLADDSTAGDTATLVTTCKELFGRLPKRTGWQPVLPRSQRASARAADRIASPRDACYRIIYGRGGGVGRGRGVGACLGVDVGLAVGVAVVVGVAVAVGVGVGV